MAEIVAGHYADGLDTLAAAQTGTLVSIKGDVVLGKGHDKFTTAINKFKTPSDGKVSVWMYGRITGETEQAEGLAYIDNVKVIKL